MASGMAGTFVVRGLSGTMASFAAACESNYRWGIGGVPVSGGVRSTMRFAIPCLMVAVLAGASASGQVGPYNPYAVAEDSPPPLAADGTIQWGVFYKSAKLQRAYERLWSLGACRGSNRAITVPVAENKLVIDRLPEADFRGVVQAATGDRAGGMVAFALESTAPDGTEALVAQLHPAGVSRLAVRGPVPPAVLTNGTVVRVRTRIDERGRGSEPISAFEIVVPPADFRPDAIRPGQLDTVVGVVQSMRRDAVVLRVDAGEIRRVTLAVADDVVATVDAPRLDLVAAGDRIEVRGRLWTGDGALAGGTVFASDVIVTKASAGSAPGATTVGAR